MKTIRILILLSCLAWFASCNSDDDGLTPDPGEQPGGQIKFEMTFAGQDRLKTATDKDFKTTWETGDAIGMFIVKGSGGLQSSGNYVDNLKMEYNSSAWTYTLPSGKEYYPNDGDNLHFYAYYPYDAAMSDPTNHTFSVETDQNGQTNSKSNYNLCDLLLAKSENVAKSSNPVNLTFSHALSLVQVEVKREVNVPHFDADDFTVTLTNAQSDASVNWTGDLTGIGTATDIKMHKVEGLNNTYRALVPAQTLAPDSKVTFEQTTTGKEIDMEYQGIKSTTLIAKNAHKYSVTLGWGIDPNHAYTVGDVYPHTGPAIGIVYWVDPTSNGKHGKVVGLKENGGARWDDGDYNTGAMDLANGLANMKKVREYISSQSKDWVNFPHFAWVHSMNDANEDYSDADAKGVWYLPTWNELGNFAGGLYKAKVAVNTGLTSAGGTTLSDVWYWSSSEADFNVAYDVHFLDGNYGIDVKLNDLNRARCVLAF